jgi:hypothetical protein
MVQTQMIGTGSPLKQRTRAQSSIGVRDSQLRDMSSKSREKLVDVSKIYDKEIIPPKKKRRYIKLTKDAKQMVKIQEQAKKKVFGQQE